MRCEECRDGKNAGERRSRDWRKGENILTAFWWLVIVVERYRTGFVLTNK